MLLWISFAVLTAFVLIALLSPLRQRKTDMGAQRASFDLAVYRDQLAELERDQQAGLIPEAEAEAARNEVSRRILAAQAEMTEGNKAERPVPVWVSIVTVLAVPAIALGAYMYVGRPDLPAQPLQSRIAKAVENQDMVAMVRQVELHLEKEPNDARGWNVLAPAYKRMGRFDDAANAYRKLLTLSGPNADTMSDLAENLVLANNGIVSKDAQNIFEAAQKIAPKHMKARFYVARAYQQEGKTSKALELWNAILADSPPDAPWRQLVQQQIASAGGELPKGPVLSQEQMQAGQQMKAGDRTAMIRTMVEGLDQRLSADGADLDGWLRLIRARMVLGEKDKALDALSRAGVALKADPAAVARLEETRKSLGF
jgi:cytochrome c-type biogenesis protein CcmH